MCNVLVGRFSTRVVIYMKINLNYCGDQVKRQVYIDYALAKLLNKFEHKCLHLGNASQTQFSL